MIIALFGPPGAGKDTVGKILVEQYAYRRVAFADKVRDLALKLNPHIFHYGKPLQALVDKHGWDIAKREFGEVRFWLERVGDGCREVLGPRTWIDAAFNEDVTSQDDIVVTDMRKLNEHFWINEWSQVLCHRRAEFWYITRNGREKRPFDEWKPEWATATIENNGTVEELAAKVRELMNG